MTCTQFTTQLQHLVMLAKQPGWKAYAWQRAQELDADPSGIWTGISEALTRAMNSESGPPVPTKPH